MRAIPDKLTPIIRARGFQFKLCVDVTVMLIDLATFARAEASIGLLPCITCVFPCFSLLGLVQVGLYIVLEVPKSISTPRASDRAQSD